MTVAKVMHAGGIPLTRMTGRHEVSTNTHVAVIEQIGLTTGSSSLERHVSTLELVGAVLPRGSSAELFILALGHVAVKSGPVVACVNDLGAIAGPLAVDRSHDGAGDSASCGNGCALYHVSVDKIRGCEWMHLRQRQCLQR